MPLEQQMSRFRAFAEQVAKRAIDGASSIPAAQKWRRIVYVRDGCMRGEQKMKDAYDTDSPDARQRAERRIDVYANKTIAKFSAI